MSQLRKAQVLRIRNECFCLIINEIDLSIRLKIYILKQQYTEIFTSLKIPLFFPKELTNYNHSLIHFLICDQPLCSSLL